MHDQQLVSNIAQTGGLGLADMIMEQIGGTNPNFKPASVLRSNGNLGQAGEKLLGNQTKGVDFNLPQAMPLGQKQQGLSTQGLALPTGRAVQSAARTNQTAEVNASQRAEKDSLFDSPVNFVKSLLPHAQKIAGHKGMEPLMLVAQAALETGWGKKVINKADGSSSHNLFGIKADARWQGEKAKVQTLEYKDGVAKKENAFFRAYDSVQESIKDYVDFLSSDPRYKKAMDNVKDPAKYFNALQSAGYATDPDYAKKIVNILNGKVFAQAKGKE
jgi:flagellar protein FlgJ